MNETELRAAYAAILADRDSTGRAGCPGPEALHRAVAREGAEAERLATVNHAMTCAACMREFEMLRSLQYAVPASRELPRWLALAASLVLLAGATLFWRATTRQEPVFRGGAEIATVRPAPGTVVDTPLELTWRAVASATEYRVEVLSDDGRLVGSRVTSDTTVVFDAALPSGQFYLWRVAAPVGSRDSLRSAPVRFRVIGP